MIAEGKYRQEEEQTIGVVENLLQTKRGEIDCIERPSAPNYALNNDNRLFLSVEN